MQSRIPDNHWLRTRPIAHRGLHDLSNKCPENSLAAFDASCKKGFPIELDVRIARDGEAVVCHDVNLFRINGKSVKVKNLDAIEFRNLKILDTGEHIPTLAEALDTIDGRVPVLIEIKNFSRPGRPENIVTKLLKSYSGEVALQCFNPRSVRFLRKNNPEHLSGLIIGKAERFILQSNTINQFINNFATPQFINYHTSSNLFMSFVELYGKQNIPILAWTVRSESEELKARKFADNIVFEGYIPK